MEFNCIAVKANLIVFFVNDTSASEQSVGDKGFIQQLIEDLNATTRRRNLTATALTEFNNTEIQCVAIDNNQPSMPMYSDIAVLLIQGMEELS